MKIELSNRIAYMFMLLTISIFLITNPMFAADQFTSRNVELVNGGIQGEVCNTASSYFDEVYIKVIAIDTSDNELWTRVVPIEGIGPNQCRSYFKVARILSDTEKPSNLNITYYTRKSSKIINLEISNGNLSLGDFKLEGRDLTGRICNISNSTLEDFIVSIIAVGDNGEALWKRDVYVSELYSGNCHEPSRHINEAKLTNPSHYLYSTHKLIKGSNIKDGRITDGISYRDIFVNRQRLKGHICNDSNNNIEDVFIRFYAIGNADQVLWDKLINIHKVSPNQCKEFSEYILRDTYPTEWRFALSQW